MKAEKAKKTRILIVDDHPMTRSGLVHLINHQSEMVLDGEAEDAAQALDLLASKSPDLMLIDITLPGKSGLELIKEALGEGLSSHEIAKKLHLSAKTVDAHRANIKTKLKINTTAELISFSARWTATQSKQRI